MDHDDLLKLLDLGAEPTRPPASARPAATEPEAASPTAFEVDAWGLRRGRDLAAESERLKGSGADEFAAADFFCAAFDPGPVLLGSCADPRRREFLAQLLATPEYRSLHEDTQLDDTAAAIAAGHFAAQCAELTKRKGDEKIAAGGELRRELAARGAAGRAASEAAAEVAGLRDASAALGVGPGSPGASDPRAVAELFRRVRADPALRRICELAGRFRRVAQSRQRTKTSHGVDDVVGVEPGGDIARLLPSELLRLAAPELELDALRRVVERQALCLEYRAAEPTGRGPVVVCVDESGSMEGAKCHAAKALALALAWVARHQGRWCALVAYSGDSGERLLALPPGRWDESKLIAWLSAFIGGGSDIDVPVRGAPRIFAELGAPPGVTDLVFVTDARCRLPAGVTKTFLDWKRSAEVRLVSLVIDSPPGDLALVSDEVHLVTSLDPACGAAGRVLSI